jgi:hypothetical protein
MTKARQRRSWILGSCDGAPDVIGLRAKIAAKEGMCCTKSMLKVIKKVVAETNKELSVATPSATNYHRELDINEF